MFTTDIANQAHSEGNVVSSTPTRPTPTSTRSRYSATGLPGGVTINAATGVISGTLSSSSSGIHNVVITVSDGIDTDTDPFTWTVADVAAPNMALDFDGTNDHVTFGAATAGLGVTTLHHRDLVPARRRRASPPAPARAASPTPSRS